MTSPNLGRRNTTNPWPVVFAVLVGSIAVAGIFAITAASRRTSVPAHLDADLARSLPRMNEQPGFATSQQCRECHPDEHASWHASFHRQMTQVARPETVLGPFDGNEIRYEGQLHRLVRKGDEFWVHTVPDSSGKTEGKRQNAEKTSGTQRVPSPAPQPEDEGTWQRAVMTTGAHHMQLFWSADGQGNRLSELPIVYLRDHRRGDGRWAPLSASYISQSPKGMESGIHWNTDCILCHATGGVPGLDTSGTLNTGVAELGISCEACHGPGAEHVRLKREASTLADQDWQAIVNPARLPPERAAQVCGHCHAAAMFLRPQLVQSFLLSGSAYRPGDDLLRTRLALLPSRLTKEQNEVNQKYNPSYEGSFWPDGMIRITGREYNALVESTCYQKGGMTCLSCHSMHQSDPNDQLSEAGRGNGACYQCHASYRDSLTAHTHHAAGSSGSECYNCHMPHTTYGLFSAIRSHQISSPTVAATLATGRPSACNLCHLDQTFEWTNRKLAEWYGQEEAQLDEEQRSLSAAASLLLKGDAAQRVLCVWAAGWRPALEASGRDWLPPLLAPLLDDPSPVVRLVASRSLDAIDERYTMGFDFVAPASERQAAARRVVDRWKQIPLTTREKLPHRLFAKPGGEPDEELIRHFLKQRDDRGLLMVE